MSADDGVGIARYLANAWWAVAIGLYGLIVALLIDAHAVQGKGVCG